MAEKKRKTVGPRPAHLRRRAEMIERRAELAAMPLAALRKMAREEYDYDRYELANAGKTKDMLIGSLLHCDFGTDDLDYVLPDDAPEGAIYHYDDGQRRVTHFGGRVAMYTDLDGRGDGAHSLRTYYCEDDLKTMRVPELMELANDWSVKVPTGTKKSALVALLLAKD